MMRTLQREREDMGAQKDMNTVSQVAKMVEEGLFSCETDLYAFYVWENGDENPAIRVFSDGAACFEALFQHALNGTPTSDAVCLMSVGKGDTNEEQLVDELQKLLQKQHAESLDAAKAPKPVQVAVLDSDEGPQEFAKTARTATRNFSGFAWKEGDAVRVYSNAFLPHTWRNWREKQQAGFTVSPLMRKSVVIANAPIATYRANFEHDLRERCLQLDDFAN